MEIKILQKVLAANDQIAGALRDKLSAKGILCVNIMSSPGSGKTSIIEKTADRLSGKASIAVIEGDIETSIDAERLSGKVGQVVSINTGPFGGDCHLEAGWIEQALRSIDTENTDIVFIENIGNLVCPAEFDTGAHRNVVVLSLPEGEDKPLKYPLVFTRSDLLLINKIDLLDVLAVDMDMIRQNAGKVNPNMQIIEISALNGDGMDAWVGWLIDSADSLKRNELL